MKVDCSCMADDGGGIGPGRGRETVFGALEHPVNIVNAAMSNVPVIFVFIIVSVLPVIYAALSPVKR